MSPNEWKYQRAQIVKAATADDLVEELANCEDEFFAAYMTGMPEVIGKAVMAVMNARFDRMADRACELEARQVWGDEAIQRVLQESVERAAVFRMATGVAEFKA